MNLVRLVLFLTHSIEAFADNYADQYYNNDGKIGTNEIRNSFVGSILIIA